MKLRFNIFKCFGGFGFFFWRIFISFLSKEFYFVFEGYFVRYGFFGECVVFLGFFLGYYFIFRVAVYFLWVNYCGGDFCCFVWYMILLRGVVRGIKYIVWGMIGGGGLIVWRMGFGLIRCWWSIWRLWCIRCFIIFVINIVCITSF